ncbi:glucosamine-6-phosphate deaminase [Niameybacter massiliensis]|uniref:Glucosamine-6-phosphate deaminase n=1 Tax=Holtiella tumoricola TaxID=3018743 RepID=A0AA42DLV9_9FIRM|nr:glucosamine-6-phosphate deaminase [Holtiella tumoricola]MDA3731320.1 glucosamine-6-phosphate deaminase [Holtiella tumoricola]
MLIIKASSYEDLSRKAANIISAQVILNKKSVLGLATGSSPLGVYKQLIDWYNKNDIDFSSVTTVNLDEYLTLSGDNVQSYRYFMNQNFFDHINVKKENTHVPNGLATNLEAECIRYDELIENLGGIDVQLLGIGHNGHIGFNEPDEAFEKMTHVVDLGETTIEANTRFFESRDEVPRQAITMGIKSIMQAKKIILIASGNDKLDILRKALKGPIVPQVPASILQLHPNLTVIYCCDEEI